MIELLGFVNSLLTIYWFIVLGAVVFSWLYAFNVVNPSNQFVAMVGQALHALTEPLLRPIRRYMPDLGGIDISPMVLLLGILFIQSVIIPNLADLFR